jgi:hypothetical protein
LAKGGLSRYGRGYIGRDYHVTGGHETEAAQWAKAPCRVGIFVLRLLGFKGTPAQSRREGRRHHITNTGCRENVLNATRSRWYRFAPSCPHGRVKDVSGEIRSPIRSAFYCQPAVLGQMRQCLLPACGRRLILREGT